jgi:hypothetical protein
MKKTKQHFHANDGTLGVYWVPADNDTPMEYRIVQTNLDGMKGLVDGWLAVHRMTDLPPLPCGCRLVLVMNEDGHLRQLPINYRINNELDTYTLELFVGNIFIVGEGPVRDNSGFISDDFFSLPPQFRDWDGPGTPYPEMGKVGTKLKKR